MTRSLLVATVVLGALCGGCQTDFGAQTTPGTNPHAAPEIPTHGSFEGIWRGSGEEAEFPLEIVIQCDGEWVGERTDGDGTVHSLEGDVLGAASQGATSGDAGDWSLVGLLHAPSEGGAAKGGAEEGESHL